MKERPSSQERFWGTHFECTYTKSLNTLRVPFVGAAQKRHLFFLCQLRKEMLDIA